MRKRLAIVVATLVLSGLLATSAQAVVLHLHGRVLNDPGGNPSVDLTVRYKRNPVTEKLRPTSVLAYKVTDLAAPCGDTIALASYSNSSTFGLPVSAKGFFRDDLGNGTTFSGTVYQPGQTTARARGSTSYQSGSECGIGPLSWVAGKRL